MRLRPGIVSPSSADIRHKLEVSTKFRGSFHNIRIMPLLGLVSAFEKKGLKKGTKYCKISLNFLTPPIQGEEERPRCPADGRWDDNAAPSVGHGPGPSSGAAQDVYSLKMPGCWDKKWL